VKDRELLVQSTFTGHISKEVWVAEKLSLAGSFMFSVIIKNKARNWLLIIKV
jgi:hypothetical protein